MSRVRIHRSGSWGWWLWLVGCLAAWLVLGSARVAGAQPDEGALPTPAELRQMNEAGEHRICLQQIGRVLRLADGNNALEARANQRLDAPRAAVPGRSSWWWGVAMRRGLYTDDRRQLRDMIDYLGQIQETTKLGQRIAQSFNGDISLWDPLIKRSGTIQQKARDVLDAE